MRELSFDECKCASLSGGIHIHMPNINLFISNVLLGAISGALTGIGGGPVGMVAGAVAGAAIAGVGTATYDALEIKDSLNETTIASNG